MTFLQYLTSEFCGYGCATGDYDNIHKYKNNQMKFGRSDLKMFSIDKSRIYLLKKHRSFKGIFRCFLFIFYKYY